MLGYAIGYAQAGYPLVPAISWSIASVAELFREHWHTSAEVYLSGGGVPAPGTRFANPALAATYERILAEAEAASGDRDEQIEAARQAWYDGFVAEEIGKFAATEVMDVTGERHRGLLTGHDLATWHARLEPPVSYDYTGLTVCKTGPGVRGRSSCSSSPCSRASTCSAPGLEPGGAEFIHTVVEGAKLAFADREAWYGDPNFTDVPLEELLSTAVQRRAAAAHHRHGQRRAPTRPARRQGNTAAGVHPAVRSIPPNLTLTTGTAASTSGGAATRGSTPPPASRSAARPTAQPQARRGDTCHLDVADRWGNVVSATPSGGWLQSSPVIPALGFCLGTRGQMFTLTPGLPATIAPGKRPRTTLTPTLALRDGEPYLAFGTPGGDQQDQWTLHFFLNHVVFGMNLQQAIDFPAFHSAHMPSSFYPRESYPLRLDVEERVGPAVVDELRRRGHDVHVQPPWSLGRISAVARRNGMLYAAANPRGMQGYAVGR